MEEDYVMPISVQGMESFQTQALVEELKQRVATKEELDVEAVALLSRNIDHNGVQMPLLDVVALELPKNAEWVQTDGLNEIAAGDIVKTLHLRLSTYLNGCVQYFSSHTNYDELQQLIAEKAPPEAMKQMIARQNVLTKIWRESLEQDPVRGTEYRANFARGDMFDRLAQPFARVIAKCFSSQASCPLPPSEPIGGGTQ